MKDKKKEVVIVCDQCGAEINRSHVMTESAIKEKWTLMTMGAPLMGCRCPKGCVPTYSDCNMAIDFVIVDPGKKARRKRKVA